MRVWSRRVVLLGAVSALGFLSGCGSGSSQKVTRFRVVHAAPQAGNLAVRYNSEVAFPNLAYKGSTPYTQALTGNQTFHLVPAATPTGTPLVSRTYSLGESDQTIFAVGNESLDVLALVDNNTLSVTAGNARLRLVHLLSGLSSADIYVTQPDAVLTSASPTLGSVPFKGVVDYLDIAAGAYRVRITEAGSKIVRFDSGTITVGAGHVFTAVVAGAVDGARELFVLTDR